MKLRIWLDFLKLTLCFNLIVFFGRETDKSGKNCYDYVYYHIILIMAIALCAWHKLLIYAHLHYMHFVCIYQNIFNLLHTSTEFSDIITWIIKNSVYQVNHIFIFYSCDFLVYCVENITSVIFSMHINVQCMSGNMIWLHQNNANLWQALQLEELLTKLGKIDANSNISYVKYFMRFTGKNQDVFGRVTFKLDIDCRTWRYLSTCIAFINFLKYYERNCLSTFHSLKK